MTAVLLTTGLVVLGLALILLGQRQPDRLLRLAFTLLRWQARLRRGVLVAAGHRWVHAWCPARDPAAPMLVMLHGFTGSKENWYPLARALGRRFHLCIPDLPGWGESERKPDAAYGYVEQAERVAAYLRAVSPDRPVVLLGHSMGGGIAALVAARFPAQVAQVALISAAGVRFDDNAFGLAVLAGHNPFAVCDAASLRRYLATVFYDPAAKPWIPWPVATALIARRRADAAFEQAVLNRIGRGPDSLRPGEEAARITQPALLVWGRQDAVIDPSALSLYAARIPHARTLLLEGCGHMVPMERPQALAEAVLDWIGQNRDGGLHAAQA